MAISKSRKLPFQRVSHSVTKEAIGLTKVENTTDAEKPVSTAQQAALNNKADISHEHDYEPENANIQTHIGSAHAPSNAQKNSDITLEEIEAKLIGEIASHTHAGGGGGAPTDATYITQTAHAGLSAEQALSALTTGLLKVANGTGILSTATAPTDYVATGDSRLSDARAPTGHTHPQSEVTSLVADLALKALIANPAFTGITLTLANGQDIVINATTGSKIGQSGSKLGFFGVTPVVRPTAITQTYATASPTHANVTQLAAPAGGTGATAGAYSSAANRDLMIASINAARNDIANVKQVLNQVIDQLQALGILQ